MIGNYGARLQGAPVETEDADMAFLRSRENFERMAAALEEVGARLRIGEETVWIPNDPRLLAQGEIWNLRTLYGDLDLLHAPGGRWLRSPTREGC